MADAWRSSPVNRGGILVGRRSWWQQGRGANRGSARGILLFRWLMTAGDDGFSGPLAEVGNQAPLAQRATRNADIAAVQNQPMVGMEPVLRWHHLIELHLDLEGCLAGRHAGPVTYAEDVGIDRNRGFAEGDVENDVGGLAADAGQRLQRLAHARDLATMLLDELPRQRHHVLRLGAKQANGLDQI